MYFSEKHVLYQLTRKASAYVTLRGKRGVVRFLIDNCIMSCNVRRPIEGMQVDKGGQFNLGSDHKCIRLSFGKFYSTAVRVPQDQRIHYSKKKL